MPALGLLPVPLRGCSVPFTSAPAFSKARTTSIRPSRTAKNRGVKDESESGVRKSAPALSSNSTTPVWPSAAAHIRAVCPRRSFTSTFAPRAQIQDAERRLYELAESGRYDGGFQRFAQALTVAVDMAAKAFQRDGKLSGIATGLQIGRAHV